MSKVWSVLVIAVVFVVLMIVGLSWWLAPGGGAEDDASPTPTPTPTESAEPDPEGRTVVARPVVLKKDPNYFSCDDPAGRPFRPVSISVQKVTKGSTVLAVPRDEHNVPGVPPVSTAGKSQFAFDEPGIHPGGAQGNVIMTAHTWPDGTAMGNRLLARLHEGAHLTLHGPRGGGICYEVTDRIEVSLVDPPLERIYATDGPPQVVIIVCSGTRLGPGNWTHRTVWFASPV